MTNDILRKIYDGQVTVKAGEEAEQVLSARVSTIDRDREGEVILPEGIDFTRYRANPILCWQHKLDIPAVGKCISINADSRGLNCRFQFAPTPFGKELFSLYSGSYLRAFSISFAPLDFDRPTATHRSIELYEISAVNLPSNPQALVQAIGKGLSVSPGLRKELGLKDEIFIEASPEIVIEDEPDITIEERAGISESTRRILVGRIRRILARIDRIQAHLGGQKRKELVIADLKRSDLEKDYLANVSAAELDRLIETALKATLKDSIEVAVAKARGRVI